MGRRAAKVDANQSDLVLELRKRGATVQHLHMVGHGCPDICVGYRGANFLFEIKDGSKPPSARKLTPPEQSFFDNWRGQVHVIYSADGAFAVMNARPISEQIVPMKGAING